MKPSSPLLLPSLTAVLVLFIGSLWVRDEKVTEYEKACLGSVFLIAILYL